jgi:hypothetical protein
LPAFLFLPETSIHNIKSNNNPTQMIARTEYTVASNPLLDNNDKTGAMSIPIQIKKGSEFSLVSINLFTTGK